MEEILKELLEEQRKTNELLMYNNSGKDPNELLTIKQICEEFDMGENKVRKVFTDPELPVQRYTTPFKVTRQAFNKYINVSHDNLIERKQTNERTKRRNTVY